MRTIVVEGSDKWKTIPWQSRASPQRSTHNWQETPLCRERQDSAVFWVLHLRFAAELWYEVALVQDATADYSDAHMHAALEINIPSYATVIVTASEVIERVGSAQAV